MYRAARKGSGASDPWAAPDVSAILQKWAAPAPLAGNSRLTEVRRSIRNAVAKRRVHFKEQRMSAQFMQKLALGKKLAKGTEALDTRAQVGMKKPSRGYSSSVGAIGATLT